MTQLTADQQITLKAFQAAVDTYKQRGLGLPVQVAAIVADLESHIDELDFLSESDLTFEIAYQTMRSFLQSSASQSTRFLSSPGITTEKPKDSHNRPSTNSHFSGPETNDHRKISPPPVIKRFVLPLGSSSAERQHFDQYIHELRQLNPQWVVSLDYCRPGEADAYVMVYNDEQYAINHAIYLVDQVLAKAFT
jgi:hypothetical protein